MKANVGNVDRIIRAVVGLAALLGAWAIGSGSVAFVLLMVVGAILLVTAAVGFCPLYRVLGLNTCPVARN
jgi:Protein of unknown function (DUF2892)